MVGKRRILVTSALPYANGPLHIGHLAGAYLPADIYVRFQRMCNKDIAFICGSDENGAAITIKALKENTTPKEIVDKYHNLFVETFEKIGISFDFYHRTSDPLHHETSQDFFRTLYKEGKLVEKTSEQYFDETAEQFLADRYIKGTCPKCQFENAYGDQCENCGSSLSPTELIDPVSTISGNKPVLRETRHWYLPLDKDENWLREWITEGTLDGKEHHDPSSWKKHVTGQCKSWLDGGLQPRAITRDLTWGVDVPQEIEGADGKKLYVWMDAPIGYISATKAWAQKTGKNWKDYWQSEDSALVHFIGKDNIVFHCIIFPSILKAHGQYNLPVNVPANQFMNLEGDKISTSRNWAIWVPEYLDKLPTKTDELRYIMIKNMPEQKDSEFTWKGYQEAINNELVNNLANFTNRVVVLTNKYYDGAIPDHDEGCLLAGPEGEDEITFYDSEIIRLFDDLSDLGSHIRSFEFRNAMNKLMEISSKGNQILQFNEPWKAQKEDPILVKSVMNLLLQYVTALGVACRPFMPNASDRIRTILNLDKIKEEGEFDDMMNSLCEGKCLIHNGHKINSPEHLFSKIENEIIDEQIASLMDTKKDQSPTEVPTPATSGVQLKENIDFGDFMKFDFRTATIVEAKKVEKADKLLQLSLDLGFEKRTVVSGIAEQYTPEDIIGRKVTLVANLAPKKIRGIESQGMVLMAENNEGKLSFISPEEGWENGTIVK